MKSYDEYYSELVAICSTVNADQLGRRMADRKTHPTVQQTFMRLIVEFILAMAEKSDHDKRNAATVRLCKQLAPLVRDARLPLV